MFKIFYECLKTGELNLKKATKNIDLFQKLFWIAHLFELDGLTQKLVESQNSHKVEDSQILNISTKSPSDAQAEVKEIKLVSY